MKRRRWRLPNTPWLSLMALAALVATGTAGLFISDLTASIPERQDPTGADSIAGRASVIDGDTLEIQGTRIRLHGIDAPEKGQSCTVRGRRSRCGRLATRALADRIGGRSITCEPKDRDRYNRVVAVCRSGGDDLNAWMVAEGWAVAYRRYSTDYVPQEERASGSKRGVWQGEFIAPWDWRRGKRLDSMTARRTQTKRAKVRQPTACRIKGNISRGGKRIYHVPGDQYYDRTRINTAKGERWFCSKAEARTAGWRRSRR